MIELLRRRPDLLPSLAIAPRPGPRLPASSRHCHGPVWTNISGAMTARRATWLARLAQITPISP